jgi:diguanylate cyclase (GGDEF)-like protein
MADEHAKKSSRPGEDRTLDHGLNRTLPIQVATTGQQARKALALTAMAGRSVGKAFALDRPELVIGRADDAQVVVQDEGVSRRHAALARTGDQYQLTDLGSTNGTFLNDERLRAPAPLQDGDSIRIGPYAIFRYGLRDELDEKLRQQLVEMATRDPLTQAYNRRAFDERFLSEWAWATRHREPVTLCSLDADHFKRVNDTWGHAAGDLVLRELADVARALLRTEDFFARVGGEEFYVLARCTPRAQGLVMADRLRAAVEAHAFVWEGQRIPVTISLGVVTSADPGVGSFADLLRLVDERLYAAKEAGRNRVAG